MKGGRIMAGLWPDLAGLWPDLVKPDRKAAYAEIRVPLIRA